MPDRREKSSDAKLLMDLRGQLAADVLADDYPVEAVREEIRELGGDPSDISARGAAFARTLIDERRLGWRSAARAKMDRTPPRERSTIRNTLDRATLVARLDAIRTSPAAGGIVSAAFRKKSRDESSDEELAALYDDIQELLALADEDEETDL
jgi:hypothetical protein